MLATLAQRRLTWFSPQLGRAFLPFSDQPPLRLTPGRRLAFRRVAANYHLNHRRHHGRRSVSVASWIRNTAASQPLIIAVVRASASWVARVLPIRPAVPEWREPHASAVGGTQGPIGVSTERCAVLAAIQRSPDRPRPGVPPIGLPTRA